MIPARSIRALLLCSRPPWPRIGGDRVRTFHLARALAGAGPLGVVALVPNGEDPAAVRAGLPFADRLWLPSLRPVPATLRSVRALLDGSALQTSLYGAPEAHAAVADAIDTWRPDVIVCHLVRTVGWVPAVSPPLVVDLQDALSFHYSAAAPLGAGWRSIAMAVERHRIGRAEEEALDRADAVTFISERDRDHVLSGSTRRSSAVIARAVVDEDRFVRNSPSPDRFSVGFLGNLAAAHNRDMLVHFARHLLPRLRRRQPATELRVFGVRAGARVRSLASLPGVRWFGTTEDVPAALARCWLTICPQRHGSGVQNKVLESLAAGTPAVVSPIAAASLGPASAAGLLVAQPDADFADAVADLLADPPLRQRLSEGGQRFVSMVHNPDVALRPLMDLVRDLAARAG